MKNKLNYSEAEVIKPESINKTRKPARKNNTEIADSFLLKFTGYEKKIEEIKEVISKINFLSDCFNGKLVEYGSCSDSTVDEAWEDYYNNRRKLDGLLSN